MCVCDKNSVNIKDTLFFFSISKTIFIHTTRNLTLKPSITHSQGRFIPTGSKRMNNLKAEKGLMEMKAEEAEEEEEDEEEETGKATM
ncbi:hypothetical protein E2C01_091788 [Portunus trituberculatus]|uniref:Uncharacterized protein n=1 Tax=Portunus trituberculatus TaxID=210409 RepID=A0A5B7JPL3_PORTR|nr:hypothetical protein [Portunus trituberculatus]